MRKIAIALSFVAAAFSFLAFGYEYYYPKYVCKGDLLQKVVWWDSNGIDNEVLLDKKEELLISFLVKRGAILVKEDRFPLYRELNLNSNFAKKTETGYSGSYRQSGLLSATSEFNFEFNKYTKVLLTSNRAKQQHLYKTRLGEDRAELNFKGFCQRILP